VSLISQIHLNPIRPIIRRVLACGATNGFECKVFLYSFSFQYYYGPVTLSLHWWQRDAVLGLIATVKFIQR